MSVTVESVRAALRSRFGRIPKAKRARARLPRQLEPKTIERTYRKEVVGYLAVARAAVAVWVVRELARLLREDRMRADAKAVDAKALVERARKAFADAVNDDELEALARTIGRATSKFQREQLGKQVRAALGIDMANLGEPDVSSRLADFVEENVARIKTVPDRYFDEVEAEVLRGVRSGMRHEDLAEVLVQRAHVAESRAELIARDQTLTLYADLNEARQEALGVERYIWRTSLDNRVRDSHEDREGRSYAWNDPPADGHPGQPIQCRCTAEPDFSGILADL